MAKLIGLKRFHIYAIRPSPLHEPLPLQLIELYDGFEPPIGGAPGRVYVGYDLYAQAERNARNHTKHAPYAAAIFDLLEKRLIGWGDHDEWHPLGILGSF